MTSLIELQEKAKTFELETKKMFKGCVRAYLNVDSFEFYGVWGDFKTKKQAIDCGKLWAMAFKKPLQAKVVDGLYRVSIDN